MKKKTIFSLLIITVILMLLLPVMPHHHHGSRICMTIEHCDDDHAIDDRHTHHHKGNHKTCLMNAEFFFSSPSVSSDDVKAQLFSSFLLVQSEWNSRVSTTLHTYGSCFPTMHYCQPDGCRLLALRAPPMSA